MAPPLHYTPRRAPSGSHHRLHSPRGASPARPAAGSAPSSSLAPAAPPRTPRMRHRTPARKGGGEARRQGPLAVNSKLMRMPLWDRRGPLGAGEMTAPHSTAGPRKQGGIRHVSTARHGTAQHGAARPPYEHRLPQITALVLPAPLPGPRSTPLPYPSTGRLGGPVEKYEIRREENLLTLAPCRFLGR